jgi:ligand-binding SRPBCC domain-containing protein
MRHTFKTEQWVPYPIESVFAFFADPANLPRLMPQWQMARIEHAKLLPPPAEGSSGLPLSKLAGAGSEMTISFRALPLLPFRMRWEAVIPEFEWNNHFCDEQRKGPFAYWRHCHRVSSQATGRHPGTMVADHLVYELPLGFLAEPAHVLFVRDQIESIFEYRQCRLLELLKDQHLAQSKNAYA